MCHIFVDYILLCTVAVCIILIHCSVVRSWAVIEGYIEDHSGVMGCHRQNPMPCSWNHQYYAGTTWVSIEDGHIKIRPGPSSIIRVNMFLPASRTRVELIRPNKWCVSVRTVQRRSVAAGYRPRRQVRCPNCLLIIAAIAACGHAGIRTGNICTGLMWYLLVCYVKVKA